MALDIKRHYKGFLLLLMMEIPALTAFPSPLEANHLDTSQNWEWAYFVVNYLYMAGPHWVALTLCRIAKINFRSTAEWLIVLNVTLLGFAWACYEMPPRDAAFMWIFYFPLAAGVSVAFWIIRKIAHFRRH